MMMLQWGFGDLFKDTTTCGQEEPVITGCSTNSATCCPQLFNNIQVDLRLILHTCYVILRVKIMLNACSLFLVSLI